MSVAASGGSDRVQPGFPGSDANGLPSMLGDEDLAVADGGPVWAARRIASMGFPSTRSSEITISILTFGQKVDDVFRAAVKFGMTLSAGQNPWPR